MNQDSPLVLVEVTIGKLVRKDIREGQIRQKLVEKLGFTVVEKCLAQIWKFTLIYMAVLEISR